MKGHRLETISTRGGIMASCTCGEVYLPKYANPAAQVWMTWDRPKIRNAHRAHKEALA
jgi:hypothetical protein